VVETVSDFDFLSCYLLVAVLVTSYKLVVILVTSYKLVATLVTCYKLVTASLNTIVFKTLL
jgi:hypothetical protein